MLVTACPGYALGLLAKLKLPRGTQPAAWPAQPDRLAQPMLPYWPTNAVTAQALYRAGASMGPVGCFTGGVIVGEHKQPALDFSRDKIIPLMLSLMS